MQANQLESRRSSLKSLPSTGSQDCSSSVSSNNVSFSNLAIRSYDITVGDAPSSSGPPISLDWGYDESNTAKFEVEYYESVRGPRRTKSELLMPGPHRRELLMSEEWGYSRGEVDRAVVEARKVAEDRMKTRKNLKLQPMEEALEKTKKKFAKLKDGFGKNKAGTN